MVVSQDVQCEKPLESEPNCVSVRAKSHVIKIVLPVVRWHFIRTSMKPVKKTLNTLVKQSCNISLTRLQFILNDNPC